MESILKSDKRTKRRLPKYVIFSISFLCAFLSLILFSGKMADAITVTVHDSNVQGNNTSNGKNAVVVQSTAVNGGETYNRWFIQGTGVGQTDSTNAKDVITFTIDNTTSPVRFDGLSIVEHGYSSSEGTKANYDSIRFEGGVWEYDGSINANNQHADSMFSTSGCTDLVATKNTIKANGGSDIAHVCYTYDSSTDITTSITYVYTIRQHGYGVKSINLYFFDYSQSGEASELDHITLSVTVSKPISEFNKVSSTCGFAWDGTSTAVGTVDSEMTITACNGTNHTSSSSTIATDNILVNYKNNDPAPVDNEKDLFITIPKEVAYSHDVYTDATRATHESDISKIPTENTIYAINSFRNSGSTDKWVRYYYYKFDFEPFTQSSKTVANNFNMDEDYKYYLVVKVDSMGYYHFYIKDLFGNTFTSPTAVKIEDVSKSNILVDYTNSDTLTILDAYVNLVNSDVFAGEVVSIVYASTPKVMYTNLQKDNATIVLEIFNKILITEGIYASNTDDVEAIKKQAMRSQDISQTCYWKVSDVTNDTDPDKPGTASCVTTTDYKDGNSYINRTYNVTDYDNRLEITVTNNGRYRFIVTDKWGNSTDSITPVSDTADAIAAAAMFRNPYVEVTVIDSTDPTVTGEGNTLESYDYVNGGGEKQTFVGTDADGDDTLNTFADYSVIYYSNIGDKVFDYEDALRIAKLIAKDETSLAAYKILFEGGQLGDGLNNGTYTDPSKALHSDRNSATTTTTLSSDNLHNYILKNSISSFTGGLVIPNYSFTIVDNKFTLGGVEYTINYTNDRPVSVTGGGSTIAASTNSASAPDGKTFTIGGKEYRLSGNRIVSTEIKTLVAGSTYTVTNSADDIYFLADTVGSGAYTFIPSMDYPSYANKYAGFVKIEFFDVSNANVAGATAFCSLGETVNDNINCLREVNKRIDTVRNFEMKFTVQDYVGHTASVQVAVQIDDTTAPGYTAEFVPQQDSDNDGTNDYWSNMYPGGLCMLEIGSEIQNKAELINCYLIGSGVTGATSEPGTFHFKDNDTTYKDDTYSDAEAQWYKYGTTNTYFSKVKLEIEKDDGSYAEVTMGTNVVLNKAYHHKLRITIYDSWDTVSLDTNDADNYLQIIVEYYVKPRTLLIEPLANEKTYGDSGDATTGMNWDPTLGYCVYINTDNSTFHDIENFLTLEKVKANFKLVYCTTTLTSKGTSVLSETVSWDSTKTRESLLLNTSYKDTITSQSNALLNGNTFIGALSRVESYWYNGSVQNNYVGQYNIVLGTLDVGTSGGAADTEIARQYVVKVHPGVLIGSIPSGQKAIVGDAYPYNNSNTQTQDLDVDTDDDTKTESTVLLTIKQAILEVTVNGANKTYGEQDVNSHNWNNNKTWINSSAITGYLGGYSVSTASSASATDYGLKYDDTTSTGNGVSGSSGIIVGALRRQIGENVGIYRICNLAIDQTTSYAANGSPHTGVGCSLSYSSDTSSTPSAYLSATPYNYQAFAVYGDGGAYASAQTAALIIDINSTIYGAVAGKVLNTGNRNYVIKFVSENRITIDANELIVQPGINQGKEYSDSEYNDPIWEIVVYGETNSCTSRNATTGVCEAYSTRIAAATTANSFTGFTETIDAAYVSNPVDIGDYGAKSGSYSYVGDTAIYYSRRKTSPDVKYEYSTTVTLTDNGTNFTNVYSLDATSGLYYLDLTISKSTSVVGKYVYAYGTYHQISSVSGSTVTIAIEGNLVNQTYTLFAKAVASGSEVPGSATLSRANQGAAAGKAVGWYAFNSVNNTNSDFKVLDNSNAQCTVAANSITLAGSGNCRNYNLTYDTNAPTQYLNESGSASGLDDLYKVVSSNTGTHQYKPNGVNLCTDTNTYSSACSASDTDEVLFEIFKRELIISFDASNYIFVYGNRYNYYDGGSITINGGTYNAKNGVFKIVDASSEGDIFKCYSEHHVLVNCTTNDDYGTTSGDSWTDIQLEFFMHSAISGSTSDFFDTTGTNYAIPAGTYYVYANISDAAKANYNFTYLGGTLTIVPKVASIQLTSYTMEYYGGNKLNETDVNKFHSYGIGTNYGEFTEYESRCMPLSEYTSSSTDLISVTSCLNTNNAVGNMYGFTVGGLDDSDTIANNFTGRPGLVDSNPVDVGYYSIVTNTIAAKQYTMKQMNKIADTNACVSSSFDNSKYSDSTNGCVIVTGSTANNYDISYSAGVGAANNGNNEGAYLFITPAKITVTVTPNQTKMYGCAYSSVNTGSTVPTYTLSGGWANCDETRDSLDIAYEYTITGDKDYTYSAAVSGRLAAGNTTSSLVGSLFRVMKSQTSNDIYNSDNIVAFYDADTGVFYKASGNYMQDQSVGQYIITLGDLNAKTNGNSMCDAFNNPVLSGGEACRNYNLNYYGNSAAQDDNSDNASHRFSDADATKINVADLLTYDLNYVEDTNGEYVLMDGKYVKLTDVTSGINKYVQHSTLTKYSMLKEYEVSASGTYIYVEIGKKVTTSSGEVIVNTTNFATAPYIPIADLSKFDSSGATGTDYIKVDSKLVPVSAINKYVKNEADATTGFRPTTYSSGKEYVLINGTYVALDTLTKYNANGEVTANGDYILIYAETTGLTKYSLSSSDMYKINTSGTGAYVFIDGAYVLKSSVAHGQTQISINSGRFDKDVATANLPTEHRLETGTDYANYWGDATVSSDVIFTVTLREVHVHTEYNRKYIGSSDVTETITCEQIIAAYGMTASDFNNSSAATYRSYCSGSTSTVLTLGTSRYYVPDNNLAKAPWTTWTDKLNDKLGDLGTTYYVADDATYRQYSDIQYDVLEGAISRYSPYGNNDPVGKYYYDYSSVGVTDISGQNYKIMIETETDWDNTWIKLSNGTYKKLSAYTTRYKSADTSTSNIDNVNGYFIKVNDGDATATSISRVDKYRDSNGTAKIDYWYLGFYQIDENDGRSGELKKWWLTNERTNLFKNSYTKIITDGVVASDSSLQKPADVYLATKTPVYFEIMRKTIYLYAVDTSKVYGTADKYDNFKVAICPTASGYSVDGSGNVTCNDGGVGDEVYGLSSNHAAIFYDNGVMQQVAIKGGSGYILIGTDKTNSMMIYFKRSAGEDVGVYSVTACALQTGINDCSDPSQEEQPGNTTEYIGDNYNIIEMPGTMTITTRHITIVPEADQGFQYGNYTTDGSLPAIAYRDYYKYGVTGQDQGMVNGAINKTGDNYDSSTISTEAVCLLNISGESVICINDNQNNVAGTATDYTAAKKNYVEYDAYNTSISAASVYLKSTLKAVVGTTADTLDWSKVLTAIQGKSQEVVNINNVFKDSYSDPDNVYSNDYNGRSESDTRYALDRMCVSTDKLRDSRDVCNYVITAGELTVNSKWEEKSRSEYVRIVRSNVFDADGGTTPTTATDFTGKYLKVGSKYHAITASNRYSYDYVQRATGAYILSSSVYYKIVDAYRYQDASCTNKSTTGNYLKYSDASGCMNITNTANRYDLDKNSYKVDANGDFVKISVTDHNYTIETFTENVAFVITAAAVTVKPYENQYKIYGEKDEEIEFYVNTEYTVAKTHKISVTNVAKVMNGATSVTVPASGTMVVEAGWVVTLNGFAYAENISSHSYDLNYGKNYGTGTTTIVGKKHDTSEKTLTQATTGAEHYDKFINYLGNVTTSRILLGNLYVASHDQNVGTKTITNGMVVANNNLGNKNYTLTYVNTNGTDEIKYTIVPRPLFVEIQQIIKEYGQATDILSCDSGVTCTLQDYEDNKNLKGYGESYLIYNYIISEPTASVTLPSATIGSVTQIYNNDSMNLPNEQGAALTGDYSSLTELDTSFSSKYYTSSGNQETEGGTVTGSAGSYSANTDLKIVVERGNYNENSVVGDGKCFVASEGYSEFTGLGCEDVGTYYMRFRGIASATATLDSTNGATVEDYYHGAYWGYNENYFIQVTNTTDTSTKDSTLSNGAVNINKWGTSLQIKKKPIEIVIETFDDDADEDGQIRESLGVILDGNEKLGEAYRIEQNMDVPDLPVVSDDTTHTQYQKITWAIHPGQVRTADTLVGYAAYCQSSPIQASGGSSAIVLAQQLANCTGTLIYHKDTNHTNNDANSGTTNVFNTANVGVYAITRDVDQLYVNSGLTMTAGSYANGAYEANNYTTTFINGVLYIEPDETAPVIFAGTEFKSIEANNGTKTASNDISEDTTYQFLNALKTNSCSDSGTLVDNGGTTVVSKCSSTYYTAAVPITGTSVIINGVTYTVAAGATSFTANGKTYTVITTSEGARLAVLPEGASSITGTTLTTILDWFNVTSIDPSILRADQPVDKRYDARYYVAIDAHFNQRIVGDYTVYIYAMDNAGNTSRATTVTLRVKDTTAPETGNLYLYEGWAWCTIADEDCLNDKDAWEGTDHDGWSNNADGIYLNIIGGKDNTVNIRKVDVTYNKDGSGKITKITGTTGDYILNGSIVKLANITQYIKSGDYYLVADPLGTYADSALYIRMINTSTGKYEYMALDSTAVKALRYTSTDETNYTPSDTGEYIIIGTTWSGEDHGDEARKLWYEWKTDVDMGQMLGQTGTYAYLEQWEHYFSRDNGATWIKYDVIDSMRGGVLDFMSYLATGTDGQRLIMVKAVDNGVSYSSATSTNTVKTASGERFTEIYYKFDTNSTWVFDTEHSKTVIDDEWPLPNGDADLTYEEDSVKSTSRNVAGWNTDTLDRKYAYLDTQSPILSLHNNSLLVYEYNCSTCTNGYTEEYGETYDSYLFDMSDKRFKLQRYSSTTMTPANRSATGAYIGLPTGKDANGKDTYTALAVAGRLYNQGTAASITACSAITGAVWVESQSKCYEPNANGTFIYLGRLESASDTDLLDVDPTITGVIGTWIGTSTSLTVTVNTGDSSDPTDETTVTIVAGGSSTEQTRVSTIYNVAGVSGDNEMTGTNNTTKNMEDLTYKFKQITIFVTVSNPNAGTNSNSLTDSRFGSTAITGAADVYFKYVITCNDAETSCSITGYRSSSNDTFTSGEFSVTGKTSLSETIYVLINHSLTASTDVFKGKDLTYSVNYTTTDMAGNTSRTEVRGIWFSNMLEAVTIEVATAGGAVSLYNNYSIDVAQNTSVVELLGNFKITTTKSSSDPSLDKHLIQTIYYNNMLLVEEQEYNPNTLSQLDTSVPGVYKLVYSTKRLDGDAYVYGTPLELTINVKPNIAEVNSTNFNYKQVIIPAIIALGSMCVVAYVYMASKKRKFN